MTYNTPAPQPSGGQLLVSEQARDARQHASLVRAEALLQVAGAKRTIWQVLEVAATQAGKPLLRLSLRQLLLAEPGIGVRTQEGRLKTLLDLLQVPMEQVSQHQAAAPLTVQWLIDPRVGGRRMLAFIDVMGARADRPTWRGFPFHASPSTDVIVQGTGS